MKRWLFPFFVVIVEGVVTVNVLGPVPVLLLLVPLDSPVVLVMIFIAVAAADG